MMSIRFYAILGRNIIYFGMGIFNPVFGLRALATLTIFISPFWGLLVANIFDAIDVVLMDLFRVKKPANYHRLDKFFDNLMLIASAIVIFVFNIIPAPYVYFAVFLFCARIAGSVYFIFTNNRYAMLVTPNFFMYYAWAFFGMYLLNNYGILQNTLAFNLLIAGLFIFNYGQEIVLHLRQYTPWVFIRGIIQKR